MAHISKCQAISLPHVSDEVYNSGPFGSSSVRRTIPFMAKLGFLGLGIMGYPMARNLLRAGHEVALWSNTDAKAQELAKAEKGIFCETPKQVGAAADCIFLCVGDTEMASEVIL